MIRYVPIMIAILFVTAILMGLSTCSPEGIHEERNPQERTPADSPKRPQKVDRKQQEEQEESCQMGNPCDF